MIENLPNEILYHISCYLDRNDVLSLMSTSKDMKERLSYRNNYFNYYRNLRNKLVKKWCPSVPNNLKINNSLSNQEIQYYFDIIVHFTQFIETPHLDKFIKNMFCSIYYHQYLELYFLNFYSKSNYINFLTKSILLKISNNQDIINYDLSYFDLIDTEIYLYLFNEFKIEFPFNILHKFFELTFFPSSSTNFFVQDEVMFEFASYIVCKDISFFKLAKFEVIQKLIFINTNQICFDCFCIYVDRFINEDLFGIYEFYYTCIKFLINNSYIFDKENYLDKGIIYYFSVFYSLISMLIKVCVEYEVDDIKSFKSHISNIVDIPQNITSKFYQFKQKLLDYVINYDFDLNYFFFQQDFKYFVIDIILL
jgi:hypothetical protein